MSLKTSTFASVVMVCAVMAATTEAQLVRKLGNLPFVGKVKQASMIGGCDSCAEVPCCDDGGCTPSCGLAGSLLGGCFGAGPGGCGATIEPSCGSVGLGYGGGFGMCGGSCDTCGDGGYLGRNLRRVSPCACGGSLIGDMARGLILLVDRAVGTTVATLFGGLQRVTCHASGTLAALQCMAASACNSCGVVGCDGGPACGMPGPMMGCDATCGVPAFESEIVSPSYSSSAPGYIAPAVPANAAPLEDGHTLPMAPTPAPIMESAPAPAQPTPTADPFLDDTAPTPQARSMRTGSGYSPSRLGPPSPPTMLNRAASSQPRFAPRRVQQATYIAPAARSRYLQGKGRTATLRR